MHLKLPLSVVLVGHLGMISLCLVALSMFALRAISVLALAVVTMAVLALHAAVTVLLAWKKEHFVNTGSTMIQLVTIYQNV